MARKQSSPALSTLAAEILRDPYATARERRLAGSVLGQDETPGQSNERATQMAEVSSTGRWAIIVKRDDGKEEVSVTNEGMEPELRDDQRESGQYSVEEVHHDVMIGMVRGGEYNSTGGFGFETPDQIGTRTVPGATRMEDSAGDAVAKSRMSEPTAAEAADPGRAPPERRLRAATPASEEAKAARAGTDDGATRTRSTAKSGAKRGGKK